MAHDLRLPLTPGGAAKALLTAVPKRIAVGRIDYRDFNNLPAFRFFTVAACVGGYAQLFFKLHRPVKERMGVLAYLSKATHRLLTPPLSCFLAESTTQRGA